MTSHFPLVVLRYRDAQSLLSITTVTWVLFLLIGVFLEIQMPITTSILIDVLMAEYDRWVHLWMVKKWFAELKLWLSIITVQLFIFIRRNGLHTVVVETLFAQRIRDKELADDIVLHCLTDKELILPREIHCRWQVCLLCGTQGTSHYVDVQIRTPAWCKYTYW